MNGAMLRLFRPRLALMNGVAAAAGYLPAAATVQADMLLATFAGTTLLAAGGSAINQVMDADLDARMRRTCDRPIPSRLLGKPAAACAGLGAILGGLLLLGASGSKAPAMLGCFSLACYLAIYTPLKKLTPLALPIGALSGAVPPLIGGAMAGSGDLPAALIAGMLYLWQFPHFLLLQHRNADDYRQAGIPLFQDLLPANGVLPVCRLWSIALTVSALLLPTFGIVGHQLAAPFAILLLPMLFLPLLDAKLFTYLNFFPLLLALTFIIQI